MVYSRYNALPFAAHIFRQPASPTTEAMEASSDAQIRCTGFAGIALAAVDERVHHNVLADLQICDVGGDFRDFTRHLMPCSGD
jgi:sulfite reductase beta subunit-like hemoprotein